MRDAFGVSTITLSPKSVLPSYGALPVATTRLPFAGSTAAPLRDQIAESLEWHELGRMIVWRSAHSEFHTCAMRPLAAPIVTTCPWYGGASPMYPPVVAITSPLDTFSDDVIFSRVGSRVMRTVQTTWPFAASSLRMRPSDAAA